MKKLELDIGSDEEDPMSGSMSFEIGAEGLKFIKENLQLGKHGLSNATTGEIFASIGPQDIEFFDIIGKGAAGVVQRAVHKQTGMQLAIKTINVYERDRRHQLLNDLRVFITSKCPFLVKFYGAYFEEGIVKVALELMDLGSVATVVKTLKEIPIDPKKKRMGLINEPVLTILSQQILNGLLYLHKCKKQLHRDIKPDNILLNSQGEAKLSDFGISKELDKSVQLSGTFVGTVTYMSPERIEGKKYSFPSDVWSFGLVLYEMATGLYPYPQSVNYMEILDYIVNSPEPTFPKNCGFSAEFADFLSRCLQKDPSKRDTVAQLCAHPWILQYSQSEVDIENWVQEVLNAKKMKGKMPDIPTAKVSLQV